MGSEHTPRSLPMQGVELCWENQVPEDTATIVRVLHWKHHGERKLRTTNFYASREEAEAAIQRIEPSDLIRVQEFTLAALDAAQGGKGEA